MIKTPTKNELEKLRLLLSTYQDGTGQLALSNGQTLPGWRDFERSVAQVFNGIAQESKSIFDVVVPITNSNFYGISCKMRNTLKTAQKKGRVTIEVSNSSGKFWSALRAIGLSDYDDQNAAKVGDSLIKQVESWYDQVSQEQKGTIQISRSFYLILQWDDKSEQYQLYQFPIYLPQASNLFWKVDRRRLIGANNSDILIEWYGYSGGQLKYYPLAENALWVSPLFKLEPLPQNNLGYGLLRKVNQYFPDLWLATDDIL